jgi:hypothetical protein
MANRFPLVLDTTDGNKIKELPSTDDLDLSDSNIVNVQDITSVGTISTQQLLVRGNTVDPVNLLELEDSPSTYANAASFFLKVNAAGTGIEFAPLGAIGTIQVADVVSTSNIIPDTTNTGQVGTTDKKWNKVIADQLIGDLVTDSGSIVFDSSAGVISYAALAGAPTFLSEFTDDVGFLRTADLDSSLSSLFSADAFNSDIQGSVFGDDSSLLVDGVNSEIVGDVNNNTTTSTLINAGVADITTVNVNLDLILTGSRTTGLTVHSTSNISGDGGLTLVTNGSSSEEEILLQPAGADGKIKFQANAIQFVGDVTTGISASGGFTGDLTGSVVSDNSTVIIDGVAGKIVSPNVTGTANFEDDVVITGDLTVNGTTTSIQTTDTEIKDNRITLNAGEAGAGVTLGTSGIEIDRGTSPSKSFVWDETTDKWTLGAETLVAATVEAAFTGNLTGDTQGTHTGAVVGDVTGNAAGAHTGTFDGDMTGTMSGDDSTILVDGVNNKIVGAVDTTSLRTSEFSIALGHEAGQTNQGNTTVAVGFQAGKENQGTAAVAIGDSAGESGQGTSSVAVGISSGKTNQGMYSTAVGYQAGKTNQGQYSVAIGNEAGETNQAANSIVINATGSAVENTTASSTVIQPVRNQASANVMMYNPANGELTHTATPGTLAANIDQTTVDIGATTATAINIGNSGSTTTIDGTVSFSTALVANNITADDSIQITTASGANNGITLNPQGTNTSINLTADAIRTFSSPFTDTIIAQAGVTGDVKGSIVGDDSTVLIDAVNNNIPKANIQDSTNWDTAFSWGNHASGGYITSATMSTAGNTGTGTVDISGGEVLTAVGTTNQINVEASAFALSFSLASTIETDLQGSVFADDSSIIIDGTTGTVVGPLSTIVADVQQISGPGDISLETLITEITTTGTDDAYTLADGVLGQVKIIAMIVDGGDAIVTPTTLATGTTITFSDVNDNITLLYTTNGWLNTANQNATIA